VSAEMKKVILACLFLICGVSGVSAENILSGAHCYQNRFGIKECYPTFRKMTPEEQKNMMKNKKQEKKKLKRHVKNTEE
jgi:hypothetical protein